MIRDVLAFTRLLILLRVNDDYKFCTWTLVHPEDDDSLIKHKGFAGSRDKRGDVWFVLVSNSNMKAKTNKNGLVRSILLVYIKHHHLHSEGIHVMICYNLHV